MLTSSDTSSRVKMRRDLTGLQNRDGDRRVISCGHRALIFLLGFIGSGLVGKKGPSRFSTLGKKTSPLISIRPRIGGQLIGEQNMRGDCWYFYAGEGAELVDARVRTRC